MGFSNIGLGNDKMKQDYFKDVAIEYITKGISDA